MKAPTSGTNQQPQDSEEAAYRALLFAEEDFKRRAVSCDGPKNTSMAAACSCARSCTLCGLSMRGGAHLRAFGRSAASS
jgi:hypothetical protein